jgi:hypothetical protein
MKPVRSTLRRLLVIIGLLVLTGSATSETSAQTVPTQTEIKALSGRVEVVRRGQSLWSPAAVGTRLNDGDEIRAWGGASAELVLPDSTSILVAENTRFAVTRVAVDQSRRVGVFHLAVGKVRATLAEGAIRLVQNRQSNFAITTPGGVAAARGTIFVVGYDAVNSRTLVAVTRGQVAFIDCITGNFRNISVNQYVTMTGGQPMSGVVPTTSLPEAIQNALTAPANPTTAGQRAINDRTPPGDCGDFGQIVTLLTRAGVVTGAPPIAVIPQPQPPIAVGPGPELTQCTSQPCPIQ